LVREFETSWISTVLHTDFHRSGELEKPTAIELARLAIENVGRDELGKDGISYLMNALASGIETPLTPSYRAEILRQTKA
jgi:hypothetical protein